MRLLVVSDSHGDLFHLKQALRLRSDADAVLFLGDGAGDFAQARASLHGPACYAVAGNCDFGARLPSEGVLDAAGKTVYYTHGHLLGVKDGLERLRARARARHADVALFGHTHLPFTGYDDGLYLLNPGSLGHPAQGGPSFGVVDITPAGIVLNVVRL